MNKNNNGYSKPQTRKSEALSASQRVKDMNNKRIDPPVNPILTLASVLILEPITKPIINPNKIGPITIILHPLLLQNF